MLLSSFLQLSCSFCVFILPSRCSISNTKLCGRCLSAAQLCFDMISVSFIKGTSTHTEDYKLAERQRASLENVCGDVPKCSQYCSRMFYSFLVLFSLV